MHRVGEAAGGGELGERVADRLGGLFGHPQVGGQGHAVREDGGQDAVGDPQAVPFDEPFDREGDGDDEDRDVGRQAGEARQQLGRLAGALADVLLEAGGGEVREGREREHQGDADDAQQQAHQVGGPVDAGGEQRLVAGHLVDVALPAVAVLGQHSGGAVPLMRLRALLAVCLFLVSYHQSPPGRWWHDPAGQGGIRVHFGGRGLRIVRCVVRRRTLSDRVAVSVVCGSMGRMSELPEYAERVLAVAELIPSGRVMTYGDVAEWLDEGGPRQVGRVMALYGGAVPWWRVVRADGTLLPGHEARALERYRAEGTPLRETPGHAPRLAMARARWDGSGVNPDT